MCFFLKKKVLIIAAASQFIWFNPYSFYSIYICQIQENTLFGETPIYYWAKKNTDSFGPNTRVEKAGCPAQSIHKPAHGFIACCNSQGGQIQNQTSPCRRNEFGVSNVKQRTMIKCTYLYRELMLRLKARKITYNFYRLREKGMLNWRAYGKHRESIQK